MTGAHTGADIACKGLVGRKVYLGASGTAGWIRPGVAGLPARHAGGHRDNDRPLICLSPHGVAPLEPPYKEKRTVQEDGSFVSAQSGSGIVTASRAGNDMAPGSQTRPR